MLCFVGIHKSLVDSRNIGVTARKYQVECVQLWRVVGVANNLGTLVDMEGGFCNVARSCTTSSYFSSIPTKWLATRCLAFRKAFTKAIQLEFF